MWTLFNRKRTIQPDVPFAAPQNFAAANIGFWQRPPSTDERPAVQPRYLVTLDDWWDFSKQWHILWRYLYSSAFLHLQELFRIILTVPILTFPTLTDHRPLKLSHSTARNSAFLIFFLIFNNCIVPLGFLPCEIRVAFPGERQLRQSRVTQPTMHARCFYNPPSSDVEYRIKTCAQMLMHVIAHGGVRTP